MTARFRSDTDGFTLIEVMVAALIIVLAFTALAVLFINGQSAASADVEQSQLINVADQQLEQVRALVNSTTNGFDALAVTPPGSVTLSSYLTPPAATAIRSTWLYPDQFAYAGPSSEECFEIDNNYDNVNNAVSAAGPGGGTAYGAQPSGFMPWSDCGAFGEPVQELSASGLVTLAQSASHTCALNASTGNEPATVYSPCAVTLGGSQFSVYTMVTDTYVGCGTSGSTGETCPPLSGGAVQTSGAGGCGTTGYGTTGTFGTTASVSVPCADARRVTVAVVPIQVHQQLARVTPVYLSAIFTNPSPSGSQQSGSLGIVLGASL